MRQQSITGVITDGTKAIPLSDLRPDAWHTWTGMPDDDPERLSVYQAMRVVPWLYRAIDVRAKAVQALPYALFRDGSTNDVSQEDTYRPLRQHLRQMLYQTEALLCLYGANYYELGTNRAGRNLTPFWLAPGTVQIESDGLMGLRGFRRLGPQGVVFFRPDQLLYVWLPSLTNELGPGLAPAAVALSAAGLLHNLDRFASGFFERGAIKMTLLTVEGNPPPGEIQKLDSWWKRMVSGVKNAFGSVVIRSTVKPVVIGSSVQETSAPELLQSSREAVATGIGVPHSLLASNVLAGGTADAERLAFYEFTVVPAAQIIEDALNARWLSRIGLRLQFQPERLEIYQQAEMKKATALMQLAGGVVLITTNEARERLGMEPVVEAVAAGPASTTIPDQSLSEPTAGEMDSILLSGDLDALKALACDLDKWERKALKRLTAGKEARCEFASMLFPPELTATIANGLSDVADRATLASVFGAAKAGDVRPNEQIVASALAAVLQRYGRAAVEAIMDSDLTFLRALSSDLSLVLTPELTARVMRELTTLDVTFGIPSDPAEQLASATQWASQYTAEVIQGITERTKTALEAIMTTYRATPGMSRTEVLTLLQPLFGERRAELIAITELTRAAAQATIQTQNQLATYGVMMERRWVTAADERVCPICSALHGTITDRLPPAHPRCRCGITLRRHTDE